MRRWGRLNERQLMVLKRVCAGDDLSGPDGIVDRRSAGALADRGLLTVSRRGSRWRAEITDSGRFYLEHGNHPDDPALAGSAVASERPRPKQKHPATDGEPHKKSTNRAQPRATAAIHAQRRAAAAELLHKLEDTGQVVASTPDANEEAELRRVIDFIKRHGLAPEGKRIEKSRRYGRVLVRLVDGAHVNSKLPNVAPIPVPDSLASLHPLLGRLSAPADVLGVSPDSLTRALRIIHALLAEAERRGYEVGWADDTSQGIEIRIDGHVQTITILEEETVQEVCQHRTSSPRKPCIHGNASGHNRRRCHPAKSRSQSAMTGPTGPTDDGPTENAGAWRTGSATYWPPWSSKLKKRNNDAESRKRNNNNATAPGNRRWPACGDDSTMIGERNCSTSRLRRGSWPSGSESSLGPQETRVTLTETGWTGRTPMPMKSTPPPASPLAQRRLNLNPRIYAPTLGGGAPTAQSPVEPSGSPGGAPRPEHLAPAQGRARPENALIGRAG